MLILAEFIMSFLRFKVLMNLLVRHFQYKLEHLLRCEDRNSMAFSLEARVPYLDHRLIQLVLSAPGEYKITKGETKYLQKQALSSYTVPEITNRKDKIGFGTPVDNWMKTPDWKQKTEESTKQLKQDFSGVFNSELSNVKKSADLWKINQLATWKRVCFSPRAVSC